MHLRESTTCRFCVAAAILAMTVGAQDITRDSGPRRPRPRPVVVVTPAAEVVTPEMLDAARRDVSSESPTHRTRGLTLLVDHGGPSDMKYFLSCVDDSDICVSRCAFNGVLAHGPNRDDSVAAAVRGLRTKDGWIIEQSLLILVAQERRFRGGPDPVTIAVVPVLSEIAPRAMVPLLEILVARGSAGPAIAAGLRVGAPKPLMLAAMNAARLAKPTTITPRLMMLAEGRDPQIIIQAMKALVAIEGERLLPWLLYRLQVEDRPRVRDEVATSLRMATGQMFGSDVDAWRRYAASKTAPPDPVE